MKFAHVAYPAVRRSSATYQLHGRTIPEPYDYLEDPNSEETKAFVKDENQLFEASMAPHEKLRESIRASISQSQNYPRKGHPSQRGDHYYYYYNSGLLNQSMLMRSAALGGEGELFLDPNQLSEDGTSALGSVGWSRNDVFFAYAVNEKGSDWAHIRVRSAQTLKDTADRVDWCKFSSISWWGDTGFFYTRYPELEEGAEKGAETSSALNPSVCFHALGTAQEADIPIFSCPEHPTWSLGAEVSDCHRYLLLYLMDGCEPNHLCWVAPLPNGENAVAELKSSPLNWMKVVNEFVGEYQYLGNDDELFYFVTTKDAPQKSIISIQLSSGKVTCVVPEGKSVLSHASLVEKSLLLVYMEDVKDVLYFRSLSDAALTRVPLPIGTLAIHSRREKSFVSLSLTSFTTPSDVYAFDIKDPVGTLKKLYGNEVKGFSSEDFVTEQRFYNSADGTRIPMFLVHRKGALTDKTPLLVYAYGGFNISIQPSFSASRLVFLNELGGCFVVLNIRGGGEYGNDWHNAGRRETKQNCYVDFIEGLRFLHKNHIGSPKTTVIQGGSNGGLMVGAVVNQAPQEMCAAVAQVGVMDMFKFHKFTIGHAWISDFGNPDVKEDFGLLEKYSPLHNVKPATAYPSVIVLTGDHDDRVVPLHSLKYLAELQHANPDISKSGPFLGRIEVAAGHGRGKPLEKIIRETADVFTFIAVAIGIEWPSN